MSAWKNLKNNKDITELPHYAINNFLPADSYFTSKDTATKCYNIFKDIMDIEGIKLKDYTLIEPGAGDGGFYDLLKGKKIGIDIINRREDIITGDYLTWFPNFDKSIVIGNPPFGVRGAYALAFINRSFLFADYVAFILPMSFLSNGKGSNMKRVAGGHLIHSIVLEDEKFYSPDIDKEIKINTLFQIWKKGEGPSYFKEFDISEFIDIYSVSSDPKRWCGMDKLDLYDCYVDSSFYDKIIGTKYSFDDVKYGVGYGLVIKKNKKEILKALENINWAEYSSIATNSVKHIRIHSIEKCLHDLGYGKIKQNNELKLF